MGSLPLNTDRGDCNRRGSPAVSMVLVNALPRSGLQRTVAPENFKTTMGTHHSAGENSLKLFRFAALGHTGGGE